MRGDFGPVFAPRKYSTIRHVAFLKKKFQTEISVEWNVPLTLEMKSRKPGRRSTKPYPIYNF